MEKLEAILELIKQGMIAFFNLVSKAFDKGFYEFPIHLYPPRGSETIDARRSVDMSAPDVYTTLIKFTVPEGCVAFIRSYSLFSNIPAGNTSTFIPMVNGSRAFKFHGDSLDSFKVDLTLSNDIASEIDALLELKGGDVFQIDVQLSAAVPCTAAARVKGWLVTGRIETKRVGG